MEGTTGQSPWVVIALAFMTSATALGTAYLMYLGQRDRNRNQKRDNVTDQRVDLIWTMMLRRGFVAVQRRGDEFLIPMESDTMEALVTRPPTEVVRRAYSPIALELKRIRKDFPDDGKFIEEVERLHGKWLTDFICVKLGMNDNECLAFALIIADEPTV